DPRAGRAHAAAARRDRARGRAGVRRAAGGVRSRSATIFPTLKAWARKSTVLKHRTTLQGRDAPGPCFSMGNGLGPDTRSVTGRKSGNAVVASGASTTDAPLRRSIT